MENHDLRLEAQDLNQQAAALISAGNLESARTKLDKAIEIDPTLMHSYKNYGDLYMVSEQYSDAKNSYKKAILVKKAPELYFLCGNACFLNDDVHEGLDYYNQAIAAGFDNDEMIFFMGLAYEHLNDDAMALRYFQKASAKNPSRPDYIIKRISVLMRRNMLDRAEADVETLLRVAPELFDGYHMKTQLLVQKGDYENAIVFSKKASEKFPEDPDLMYDYIKSVALSGDYAKALVMVENAKKMTHFESAKRPFTILEAQIAAETNNYDRAKACCRGCIEAESGNYFAGEARFLLMNLLLATSDFEEALVMAEELLRKHTNDNFYRAALYYKPYFLGKLGRQEEAMTAYKEAIKLYRLITLKDPAALDAYIYRAMCLKDLESYNKALELLDFILDINAELAEVYVLKAEIYQAMGRTAQAKEQKQKAQSLKPDLHLDETEAG